MKLLDLFCGAGGAAMGYHRAGFEVVGVDIDPQPNYPFEFIQADAMEFLDAMIDTTENTAYDLIHASPPCQAYSFATIQHRHNDYSDLVAPTREALQIIGIPYVIENVEGAPLEYSITLCGSTMGLPRIRRHRLFETSWMMMSPGCVHGDLIEPLTVVGHSEQGRSYEGRTLPHGLEARQEAMGINWMTRDELVQAIPPAFSQWIGEQYLASVYKPALVTPTDLELFRSYTEAARHLF